MYQPVLRSFGSLVHFRVFSSQNRSCMRIVRAMAAVGGTAKRTFNHLRKHDRNDRNDRNEEFENWKHRWVPSAKWRFPHREPSWTVLLQEPEDGQRRRRAEAQSLLISWINVAWIFRSSTKLIQLFTSIYQGKRNTRFDPKWALQKARQIWELGVSWDSVMIILCSSIVLTASGRGEMSDFLFYRKWPLSTVLLEVGTHSRRKRQSV